MGKKRTKQFLDDVQNIVTRYLLISGFSVGISDLIAEKDIVSQIETKIIDKKKEVSKLIQNLHMRSLDNKSALSVKDNFEKGVNNILNKAIAEAGKIALKSLSTTNRMTNMISAGSKGKSINMAQMIACLGQQNVDGKRIPDGYNHRTLPHFSKYDISPESKGFVEHSFIKGLNVTEFYSHAQGGREGLIDTAVKTSETGYIQRKLIKAMEDTKVSYDLSVRNSNGEIIQFLYGDDGFNYIDIETQTVSYFFDTYADLKEKHKFETDEDWKLYLDKRIVTEMKKKSDYQQKLDKFFEQIEKDYTFINSYIMKYSDDNTIKLPINIIRLINTSKNLFNVKGTNISNINPLYVIDKLEELFNSLKVTKNSSENLMLNLLIRHHLSPKNIIKHHRLNNLAFDYIVENIILKFKKCKIEPNEMVGPVAAQSIGEPATQMTLNTFHFAGISAKSNVTRGVPRLKELLHLSKNLKSPSLTVYLKEDISYDKSKSNDVLNEMEITKLTDIINSVNVYYDPDDSNTLVEEDKELLQVYKLFSEIDDKINNNQTSSNWVIRLEFDKDKMFYKNINMELVYF